VDSSRNVIGLYRLNLFGSGWRQVMGSCKHGKGDLWFPHNMGNFCTNWGTISFSSNNFLNGVS